MLAGTVCCKPSAAAGAETGRAPSTAAAVASRSLGRLLSCAFCAAPVVKALWDAAAAAVAAAAAAVAAAAAEDVDRRAPSTGTLPLPAPDAASRRASVSWQYRWRSPRGAS